MEQSNKKRKSEAGRGLIASLWETISRREKITKTRQRNITCCTRFRHDPISFPAACILQLHSSLPLLENCIFMASFLFSESSAVFNYT